MGFWYDNPVCELGKQHNQVVSTGVTIEEGDLLYGLVRMLKPVTCLETGAGHGISTQRIGAALQDNGTGQLTSCETREELVGEARNRCWKLPVEIRQARGIQVIQEQVEPPQFIFLDSGSPDDRLEELTEVLRRDFPTTGGMLVVHDALNPNDGDYRVVFEELKKYCWPHLLLESNAGIAVFRRPW